MVSFQENIREVRCIFHLFWTAVTPSPKNKVKCCGYVYLVIMSQCKNCTCSSVCLPVLHVHRGIAPLLKWVKVMAENWRHILKHYVRGISIIILISIVLELRAWIFWQTTRSIYFWIETFNESRCGKPVLLNKISEVVAASCLFFLRLCSQLLHLVFPHGLQPSWRFKFSKA